MVDTVLNESYQQKHVNKNSWTATFKRFLPGELLVGIWRKGLELLFMVDLRYWFGAQRGSDSFHRPAIARLGGDSMRAICKISSLGGCSHQVYCHTS